MNTKRPARKKTGLVLLTAALLTSQASAEAPTKAKTQLEMNQEVGVARHQAESRLNELVAAYRRRLDANGRKGLEDAQAAWVKFRDLWCRFLSSGVEGGSAQTWVMANCLTEVTQRRIQDLEYVTRCEEGDLSCPSPAR